MSEEPADRQPSPLVIRHLQFAWCSLLCFVALGLALETLHAFKVDWYLSEHYEIRRLMWTLGHAHGTLLALVHVAFAASLFLLPARLTRFHSVTSPCLMAASVLLPGGFFLGGVFIYDGDPGIGVWLAPLGALLLLVAVGLMAFSVAWK